jgi:hypothetical protein
MLAKRVKSVFMFISCIIMLCSSSSFTQEGLYNLLDKFYAGLAQIVINNMDNPQKCYEEASGYYKMNQDVNRDHMRTVFIKMFFIRARQ